MNVQDIQHRNVVCGASDERIVSTPVTLTVKERASFLQSTGPAFLYSMSCLGIFYIAFVLFEFGLTTTYLRAMPQDLFLQLDGIYRLSVGQKIFEDFSSPLGVAVYAIPQMFVRSNADLVLSVNYANGLFLIVAFLAVAYITWTRLPPFVGCVLGIWIGLALAARMNFGGDPTAVTTAMNYNRQGTVALALAILLFRGSRIVGARIALIDGLLYALLASYALYTKFTFGLVALGFIPIIIWSQRNRLVLFFAFAVTFGLLVLAVEYGYGTRFQWIDSVRMTIAASEGSLSARAAFHAVMQNLPELLVCIVIPAWFMWNDRRLTLMTAIFFLMVAGASLALILSNAQRSCLFLPAVLFFVALPSAAPRRIDPAASAGIARLGPLQGGLLMTMLAVLTLQSGPQFANVLYAANRSLVLPPKVADGSVLRRIVGRTEDFELSSDLQLGPILTNQVSAFDAFATGRNFKPIDYFDTQTMQEYRDYLIGGMQAALKSCEPRTHILTLDFGNPFPLLLGWPPAGAMTVIHPGRMLSEQVHPSDEEMFRNVNCVLVPKLPVSLGARDFLLKVYGSYLLSRFDAAYETPLWKVLKAKQPFADTTPTTRR